jgi:hypothetical protein
MSLYRPYNKETASALDTAGFILSEIIDDGAPLNWLRYRAFAVYIASNKELMAALEAVSKGKDNG